MNLYDLDKLRSNLIRDEGLRLEAYRDTVGCLTIGVGHLIKPGENLNYISHDTAMNLLDGDIKIAESRLTDIYPQWRELDEVRQRAMLNLTFNLGYRLSRFILFLSAMKAGDYRKAGEHLTKSRWFKQVKLRGPRIVHAIQTGMDWSGK